MYTRPDAKWPINSPQYRRAQTLARNAQEPLELPTMSSLLAEQEENHHIDEGPLGLPEMLFDSESPVRTSSTVLFESPVLNDTKPLELMPLF